MYPKLDQLHTEAKKRKTNAQVRIKMEVPLLTPKTKERLLIWYFKNPILIADNSSKHWF